MKHQLLTHQGEIVKTRTLKKAKRIEMGYSPDIHRCRRQFRANVKTVRAVGGGTAFAVSLWHAHQARYVK